MSPRPIPPVADGCQGPIYRWPVRDGAGYRNLSSAAVEVYFEDSVGNPLGMRPGVVVSPKSGGQVDIMLKGRETDWDGKGHDIVAIPKFYYAQTVARTPATNLLINPSFDTDSNADGIADNWAFGGTFTGSKAVLDGEAYPSTIFGKAQLIQHSVLTDTSWFDQAVVVAAAAGDVYSCGVWHRCTGLDASPQSDNHSLELSTDAGDSTYTRFKVGPNDWYFVTNTRRFTIAHSSIGARIWTRGTLLDNRFDEAFLFAGKWLIFHGERMILPVKPRPRRAKTLDQLAGFGSFERDSDADGIGDGWSRIGVLGTLSIDKTPANVSDGDASQKVVLGSHAPDQRLMHQRRGKYLLGETWRASVRYKNSGALTGAPNPSEFGIELRTDHFDTKFVNAATAFPLSNTAAFTTITVDVTLTADANSLIIFLAYAVAGGGTIWLDDVQLLKVAP